MVQRGLRSLGVAASIAWLIACTSLPPGAPVVSRSQSSASGGVTAQEDSADYYVVGRGDTLYSISLRYAQDYKKVAEWNGISPPYLIYPGQRLRVSPTQLAATRAVIAPSMASLSPAAKPGMRPSASRIREPKRPGPQKKPVAPKTAPPSVQHLLVWRWPARGKLVRTFSSSSTGKKGLDIAGRQGQAIHAAARGQVVYSGSGLVGYGQLIIIKHNDAYLSAYAHNKKLLVKEGDNVVLGQQIAEMGDTGTDQVMLHFEIRRHGKPVDPLRYLPER